MSIQQLRSAFAQQGYKKPENQQQSPAGNPFGAVSAPPSGAVGKAGHPHHHHEPNLLAGVNAPNTKFHERANIQNGMSAPIGGGQFSQAGQSLQILA